MAAAFKVGDRVRIVRSGVLGTVTHVANILTDRVTVHGDNGIVASLNTDDLEAVQ